MAETMTSASQATNATGNATARPLNLTSMTFLPSAAAVAAAINAETTTTMAMTRAATTTAATTTTTGTGPTTATTTTMPVPTNNPSTVMTGDAAAVATVKPPHHHAVYNVTKYLVEHDDFEGIFATLADVQTVLFACISTLLPLIIALGIVFGVRYVWLKYQSDRNSGDVLPYKNACVCDNAAESQHHHHHHHHPSHPGNILVQPARVLSAQDLVNGLDVPRYMRETEVMEDMNVAPETAAAAAATEPPAALMEYATSGNHTSKNANGNIITLTLKNNHLIVETEERAVTMEESKPASRYKDGGCSFVVEVQPDYDGEETEGNKGSSDDDGTACLTDQQALVHREEIPDDGTLGFENARLFGSTNTGLSQSDLSISSQGSANPSYRYGNQLEYDAGGRLGYPMYGGSYESDASPARRLDARPKWVEFDKSPDIEKTLLDESRNLTSEQDEDDKSSRHLGEPKDTSSPGRVASPIVAEDQSAVAARSDPNLQVNGTTPNKLEMMEQKALCNDLVVGKQQQQPLESSKPVITGALLKEDAYQEDAFQEQQRKLGNGTLTPEHRENRQRKQPPTAEAARRGPEAGVFVPSHKRAGSIPPRLIEESLEMDRKRSLDIYNRYSQMKTSSRGIVLPSSLSPKFELLQNEVSPIEEKES